MYICIYIVCKAKSGAVSIRYSKMLFIIVMVLTSFRRHIFMCVGEGGDGYGRGITPFRVIYSESTYTAYISGRKEWLGPL